MIASNITNTSNVSRSYSASLFSSPRYLARILGANFKFLHDKHTEEHRKINIFYRPFTWLKAQAQICTQILLGKRQSTIPFYNRDE